MLIRTYAAGMGGLAVIGAGLIVGGCASAQGRWAGGAVGVEENAVTHQVTDADRASTQGSEPVAGSRVALWVNGLGCPQCATNADLQLKRIKGVRDIRTDLGHGKIYLTLPGGAGNPSPNRFTEAIEDAGFTLVKIERVEATGT